MKKNPVASKVALITGAARRVGAEIARILHAASMNIVVHYNESKEAAMQLCEDLNKKRDHSALAIHAAFKDPESEKMLIQKAFSVWGRLDVLINNASKFHRTFIGKTSDYAWDEILEGNLKAPFFLSQAAIPYLAEHQGVIINI